MCAQESLEKTQNKTRSPFRWEQETGVESNGFDEVLPFISTHRVCWCCRR